VVVAAPTRTRPGAVAADTEAVGQVQDMKTALEPWLVGPEPNGSKATRQKARR